MAVLFISSSCYSKLEVGTTSRTCASGNKANCSGTSASAPKVPDTAINIVGDVKSDTVIKWNAAESSNGSADVLSYKVLLSSANNISNVTDAEANGTIVLDFSSDMTSVTLTGLSPASTYYVAVIVKNSKSAKSIYTVLTITTGSDSTDPVAGGSGALAGSAITASGATIGWTAATDNFSSASAIQYAVYRSTSNNISTVASAEANGISASGFSASRTSFSDTGLSGGTTYYYNIIAKDSSENKTIYTSTSITTDATAPVAGGATITPIAIEAFPNTSNYPTVSWTPNVKFSIDTEDSVGLFSDTIGTAINTPVTATVGTNILPANTLSSNGTTASIYAKASSASSYVNMGSYKTSLPANFSISGMNNYVYALTTDSAGNVYAGGGFTAAGGVMANNIAKWNAATSKWTAMGTGTNGNVSALAIDSLGNVYAGGAFTTAGGVTANNIAKWNAATSTWTAMGTGMNDYVNAVTTDSSGNVYAGGRFTTAGGVTDTKYIAKWNGTAWTAMGTGMNDYVNALAIDSSGNVYAGGRFTTAGGVTDTKYIAKWNATATTPTWTAMGTGMNDYVYALTTDSTGNVYAGGWFTTAGGVSNTSHIAKWDVVIDTPSWTAMGTGMNINGDVTALTTDSSGNVYAGGNFTTAGGVAANKIARWNGAWTAMGTGMNNAVWGLTTDSSGNVYAGGPFSTAGGVAVASIAKWDVTATPTWTAMGTGMNGNVSALTKDSSGNVYAGGSFAAAGGVSNTSYIAKWNAATSTWTAMGTGMNGTVNALTTDSSGNVYAGGSFTTAGGVTVNRIAKWNGTAWTAMGAGMNTNGTVNALATDSSGNVYAGGWFTTAGGVAANKIAKWNAATSTWTAMGTGMNGTVNALTTDSSGNVYAGGWFTTAVGVSNTSYIAKWNATATTPSWTAMGTGMNANGTVNALTTDSSGNVYAGGSFAAAGGVSNTSYIAKWNATATPTWTAMGTGMNGNVNALTTDSSGNVYAGGSFAAAGGVSNTSCIAKWIAATSTWTAMGTGMNANGTVNALTTDSSGNVYAGGSFSTANGKFRPFFVKWLTLFGDFF